MRTKNEKLVFKCFNALMLLMVEEGVRGGICHSIHKHARANNKYMKNMIKIKNLCIFNI